MKKQQLANFIFDFSTNKMRKQSLRGIYICLLVILTYVTDIFVEYRTTRRYGGLWPSTSSSSGGDLGALQAPMYSTVQYNTVQYSAVQYSTVQ